MSETQVRPARRPITFWAPPGLVARFDALARLEQRSRAAELRHLMIQRVRDDFPLPEQSPKP